VYETLLTIVDARGSSSESSQRFCEDVALLDAARTSLPRFHALFARAARTLGTAPLVLTDAESAKLEEAGGPSRVVAWSVDHGARVAMIGWAASRLSETAFAALFDDLYYRGESREREAVLRALFYVPKPERFVPLAIEACRTNVRTIFEALACENPYAARFVPDAAFAQMVLKAIFIGTPVERIDGLPQRANAELARMVEGYASERRAASRTVPEDCARVIDLARERERR
jgi:hypothetical protein